MIKRFHKFLFLILAITMFLNVGCSNDTSNESSVKKSNINEIAYISSNPGSNHGKTFSELGIGQLFDFNLKLPKADKSWVRIWVEGYSNGKAVKPFPITELNYGFSPKKVDEGQMGFGIIHADNNERQFFLYAPGVSRSVHGIDNDFFIKNGINSWGYAIDNQPRALESGEEMILAVYRQGKESIGEVHDYQDLDSVNKMIEEDETVLLLKIKVEEKDNHE